MKRSFLCSVLFLSWFSACQPQDVIEPSFEVCDDRFDNNQDGLTDCDDPVCFSDPVCPGSEVCDDARDNDQDGQNNCSDDDCSNLPLCFCTGFSLLVETQLPLVLEGDTANGLDVTQVFGCQDAGVVEEFINLAFLGVDRIDALVESLDGIDMVVQLTQACDPNVNSSGGTCSNTDGAILGKSIEEGSELLFSVGAKHAGQTGRYRLTIRQAQ